MDPPRGRGMGRQSWTSTNGHAYGRGRGDRSKEVLAPAPMRKSRDGTRQRHVYHPQQSLPPAVVEDDELTKELDAFLISRGVYESKAGEENRRRIIERLHKYLVQWVMEFGASKSPPVAPDHLVDGGGVQLRIFGSTRLGVHTPDADIDVLCIAPCWITRADFFASFVSVLRRRSDISMVSSVPEAYTPVVKFIIDNQAIDMIFVSLPLSHKIPQELDVLNSNILYGLDDAAVRSINGSRVAERILTLVPNIRNFALTLRAVKYWARERSLYSNVLGFLGGVNYAILVGKVCQMHPRAPPSVLLREFFHTFFTWQWPVPVTLIGLEELVPHDALRNGNMSVQQSDALRPYRNWAQSVDPKTGRPLQIMPILTPCYPAMNSSYNVGFPQYRGFGEELHRAASLFQQWDALRQEDAGARARHSEHGQNNGMGHGYTSNHSKSHNHNHGQNGCIVGNGNGDVNGNGNSHVSATSSQVLQPPPAPVLLPAEQNLLRLQQQQQQQQQQQLGVGAAPVLREAGVSLEREREKENLGDESESRVVPEFSNGENRNHGRGQVNRGDSCVDGSVSEDARGRDRDRLRGISPPRGPPQPQERPAFPLATLFEPSSRLFFSRHPLYLEVNISTTTQPCSDNASTHAVRGLTTETTAVSASVAVATAGATAASEHRNWFGFLESKMRALVVDMDAGVGPAGVVLHPQANCYHRHQPLAAAGNASDGPGGASTSSSSSSSSSSSDSTATTLWSSPTKEQLVSQVAAVSSPSEIVDGVFLSTFYIGISQMQFPLPQPQPLPAPSLSDVKTLVLSAPAILDIKYRVCAYTHGRGDSGAGSTGAGATKVVNAINFAVLERSELPAFVHDNKPEPSNLQTCTPAKSKRPAMSQPSKSKTKSQSLRTLARDPAVTMSADDNDGLLLALGLSMGTPSPNASKVRGRALHFVADEAASASASASVDGRNNTNTTSSVPSTCVPSSASANAGAQPQSLTLDTAHSSLSDAACISLSASDSSDSAGGDGDNDADGEPLGLHFDSKSPTHLRRPRSFDATFNAESTRGRDRDRDGHGSSGANGRAGGTAGANSPRLKKLQAPKQQTESQPKPLAMRVPASHSKSKTKPLPSTDAAAGEEDEDDEALDLASRFSYSGRRQLAEEGISHNRSRDLDQSGDQDKGQMHEQVRGRASNGEGDAARQGFMHVEPATISEPIATASAPAPAPLNTNRPNGLYEPQRQNQNQHQHQHRGNGVKPHHAARTRSGSPGYSSQLSEHRDSKAEATNHWLLRKGPIWGPSHAGDQSSSGNNRPLSRERQKNWGAGGGSQPSSRGPSPVATWSSAASPPVTAPTPTPTPAPIPVPVTVHGAAVLSASATRPGPGSEPEPGPGPEPPKQTGTWGAVSFAQVVRGASNNGSNARK